MSYGGVAGFANTAKAANTVKTLFSGAFDANRDPFSQKSPFQAGQYYVKGERRRLNIAGIAIGLFAPWLLFCIVYALLSFKLHYTQPYICYCLVILAFGAVAFTGFLAAKAVKQKLTQPTYQPSWYMFLALTCFLAFVIGYSAGEWNFTYYMQPYYNLENLSRYQDIDTNMYVGQQLMDAGRIAFKKGTVLDLGHSMGFKSHDIFCVSPILTKGSPHTAVSVDFWAVGKNCCSGVDADFHCSGFSDPLATGVIRNMHDEDRPFYRLAVQQAEATYKFTSDHPLFFEWVHDADEAENNYKHTGLINYLLGICTYFLVQLFLTAVSALAFAKLLRNV